MSEAMLTDRVAIEAVAYELPPHRISSADIEARLSETLDRLVAGLTRCEHPPVIFAICACHPSAPH